MYICVCMTKAQKGMNTLWSEACKKAKDGNIPLRQSVHHMVNTYLNAVESPVMDACYDIVRLPITQSSIKKECFTTYKPNE